MVANIGVLRFMRFPNPTTNKEGLIAVEPFIK